MKPKRIVLIRHGESVGNVDRSVYCSTPDYAVQLTDKGKNQAEAAGVKLKELAGNESVKFYISPFWRTRQTFQQILKAFPSISHTDAYEDSRLREQEWSGRLPEKGFDEAAENERNIYGHFYYRFDGGESCADVSDRVTSFMNTLHRDFEKKDFPENCVIVTHGKTFRVILMRWLHLSVEEFELLKNPKNCEFGILELQEDGRYKLVTEHEKYVELDHKYQFKWHDS